MLALPAIAAAKPAKNIGSPFLLFVGGQVRISVNGRRIYIGRFTDQMEAVMASDKAAMKYHGRFASVNFET